MALKWPIMCWCAVKKLLTHSLSKSAGHVFSGAWNMHSRSNSSSDIAGLGRQSSILFFFFIFSINNGIKCDFTTQYIMSRTTRLNSLFKECNTMTIEKQVINNRIKYDTISQVNSNTWIDANNYLHIGLIYGVYTSISNPPLGRNWSQYSVVWYGSGQAYRSQWCLQADCYTILLHDNYQIWSGGGGVKSHHNLWLGIIP